MLKLVLDASPLIVLGKVGLLHLLSSLAEEVVIPEGVSKEILAGSSGDPAREWLKGQGKVFVRKVGPLEPEVLKWDLGLGETEVLSFAYRNRDFIAVVDDRAARRCAKTLGIKVKGTLALLVLAHRKGLLEDVLPVLHKLQEVGFRVSGDLVEAIKRLVSS